MSDKYNETTDDFFAKFDEIDEKKANKITETDTYSADAADAEYSYGSASTYRSDTSSGENAKPSRKDRKASKAEARRSRNKDNKERKEKNKAKVNKAKAKTKKNISNAKAKAVAASSKFGGSASGSTKRKPLKKDTPGKAILKTVVSVALIAVFAVGIYVGFIFLKAPTIDAADNDIYSQISQRSIMVDTDGNEIDSLYFSNGNRTVIDYEDIPQNMVNAVIAIEDHKFWTHNGFNFIRMIGAVKESLFGGGEVSGTSTVTQQLARNVYLAEIKSQRSLSRKLTEMYCTIVLEKQLSKEKIMEAYLNTIYLGFNSYGIEAAAESYFNKTASELTLQECAALAALPQSPDVYALVYSDYYNTQTSLPKIKKTQSVTYLYNGDLTKDRREYILNSMYEDGKISKQEYDEAISSDLKDDIEIGVTADASRISYYTDYALEQVIDGLMEEYGISETDAENMVYTKGLKIQTSMDSRIQKIMEEEFEDDDNFTSISYTRTNEDDNLISEDGVVLAYAYTNYIQDDCFTLSPDEYDMNSDGSMTIRKDKRLNFYQTTSSTGDDISVEFKSMYKKEDDGKFYFIESGALAIPAEYKSLDDNGNCVVSAQFFTDYPDFFKKTSEGMRVTDDNYTLKQKIRQPQAAAVIIENKTGEVRGMMGGRGATGKQLYNRAVNPRQPGSSIKPIAVYGPALQMSYEYHKNNKKLSLDTSEGSDWGKYVTAGSVINDSVTKDGNGRVWPKNDDGGYHGPTTVREALQQSLNVCSYKIFQQIDRNEGADYCQEMLEKNGITTLDSKGADQNPAAMALGGLTYGLTPLEEAAAYETFVNGGVYKSPVFYTAIYDSNDNLLFEKQAEESQVYDPGVAWIMTDVLHSVVTNGIGRSAYINSQPAGGKTGTTSNMYDIWFSGFTPYYSMSLWMGNDINMSVSNYSYKAAGFWAAIMERVCENLPRASFAEMPDTVEKVGSEYYTKGTYSKVAKKKSKSKTKKEKEEEETTTTKATQAAPKPTTKAPTKASSEEKQDTPDTPDTPDPPDPPDPPEPPQPDPQPDPQPEGN